MKLLATILLVLFYPFMTFAQETTEIVGDSKKIRVDEILYNKQTGKKMTGEDLYLLLQKTPGLGLEPIYNREGKPSKYYYDPENPFYEPKRDPEFQPKVNEVFPPTTFIDLSGKKHHLDSMKGQWIFIDFNFLPRFIDTAKIERIKSQLTELRESGVIIQSFEVLSSQEDPLPVLGEFQDELIIINDARGFFEMFHITPSPISFLIDPSGNLVQIFRGEDRDFKSYILNKP